MRFLFIVQTEGRGHMSQALVLADWLEQAQHEVGTVLVGMSHKGIPEYFLNRFHSKIKFFESPHFSYDIQQKGLHLGFTFLKNFARTPTYLKSIRFVKKEIKRAKPDVIINFYDLIGSLAQLGFEKKHPYIVVSHHFYLTSGYHSLVKGRPLETSMLKALNRIMATGADKIWALSFRATEDRKKLKFMPPLIRNEIMEAIPSRKDYLLAYSVNEGYAEEIKAWQSVHPETVLHYFWTGAQQEACEEVQKNLFFHRIDQQKFTKYLIDCKGYMSTAGFESICEALYLSKPVVLVPVARHLEQANNAQDATREGNCMIFNSFEDADWLDFMDSAIDNTAFREWVNSGKEAFLRQFV